MAHRLAGDKFRWPHSTRGFTMVEMIVVLVVLAAVAAVAVPNLQPAIAGMQLQAAARDIASGLRHVRGYALAHGGEGEFLLDVNKHFYQVSGRRKAYGLPASVKLELFTAETEMSGDGRGIIRFYPDGSATGGRVTLQAAGKQRQVDVNWLTGAIVVREDNP